MKVRTGILAGLVLAAVAGTAWVVVRGGRTAATEDTEARDDAEAPPAGSEEPASRASLASAPAGAPAIEPAEDGGGGGGVVVRVLWARDGSPAAGASVALAGTSADGDEVAEETRADVEGAAEFDRVPAGREYSLRAVAAGAPPAARTGIAVAEEEVTDAGTIWLDARGIVEGLVLGEDRKPVAGAEVVASREAEAIGATGEDPFPVPASKPHPYATATTDAEGVFRLAGLPEGLVVVTAAAPGRRTGSDRAQVTAGDVPARVTILLRAGRPLEGTVVDGVGQGVKDALVEVGPPAADGGTFSPRVEARTGEGGGFSIPAFGEGEIRLALRATARDASPAFVGDLRWQGQPVTVVLASGARLEVVALDDETEEPVAEVRLTAFARGGRPRDLPARRPPGAKGAPDAAGETVIRTAVEEKTGLDGVAVLILDPGPFPALRLAPVAHRAAQYDPPRGWTPRTAIARVRGDLDHAIDLGETRKVTLRLRRGIAVEGRATDPGGDPIPRLRLTFPSAGPRGPRRATTGPDGTFRFENVLPPVGGVISSLSRAWRVPHPPEVIAIDADRNADLRHDAVFEPVEATAAPGPAPSGRRGFAPSVVRGRVVGPRGGPVRGALVTYAGRRVTGPDGTFRFEGLAPTNPRGRGAGALVAAADGCVPAPVVVRRIVEGDDVDLGDVSLTYGDTIYGVVLDTKGSPARFALVEALLWGGQAMPSRTAVCDEFGKFEFRALPRGSYIVRIRSDGWMGGASGPVSSGGGRLSAYLEIRVAAIREVRGRLVNSRGIAVHSATVEGTGPEVARARAVLPWLDFRTRTVQDGEFTVHVATDGSGTLRVTASGYETLDLAANDLASPAEVRLVKPGERPK